MMCPALTIVVALATQQANFTHVQDQVAKAQNVCVQMYKNKPCVHKLYILRPGDAYHAVCGPAKRRPVTRGKR